MARLPAAAVILEHGVIRTLHPTLPVVPALAIAGDRIAGAVGTHETALASPEIVDLGGRSVLPGFTDSHVHFLQWSLYQREARLEQARSLEDAVRVVAEAVRKAEAGSWVRGSGWRSADWQPPVEPTRHALDPVSSGTPVALMARDGHALWLNSAALARADGDLAVPGGVVERDETGEPTGVLREESAWAFRQRHVLSAVTKDEWHAVLREGLQVAASRGVTAVHDKDGWLGALSRFQRLRDERALTLRVWQSLPHELLGSIEQLGLTSGLGDDHLRAGYLKVFMDGTLGSQTARLLEGGGVEITSRDELVEIVRRAAAVGWPVAVHAIGDRANRDALDAFEQTAETWRPLRLRHRIEHAQLLAAEDVPRFGKIGVAASVQFSHAPSDRDLADRLWAGRTDRAYAYRSLWDAGALIANGSDAPVEELDPLAGLAAGVLRTLDERPAWHPEQALTVGQALDAATVSPAWLTGDERRRGKLLPGYLADLVVLDRDPLAIAAAELPELRVVATMVGGRWTYGGPPWD
ncbi:MAG: amidohydrolase [Candidatus Rokuibacteriota bacterium]|nr:MAG: amidohydrolase [Candidatus Rokubacteria bacterium]